jgi:CHASE3 domain sensor protein
VWNKLKKKTRQRIIRTFTLIFLVLFVLSVAAALLITGLQAPGQ